MRVKIVSGNEAGTIRDYDEPAAQSLLDSGFAIPAPLDEVIADDPAGPVAVPVTVLFQEPAPKLPEPAPEMKKGDKAK